MIDYDGKTWTNPTVSVEGQEVALTTDEIQRIPTGEGVNYFIQTLEDATQYLVIQFPRTSLGPRLGHVQGVTYERVFDQVAIPFLMGSHARLGANSLVRLLETETLRFILYRTVFRN